MKIDTPKELIELLIDNKIEIYTNDNDGDIVFRFDSGETYSYEGEIGINCKNRCCCRVSSVNITRYPNGMEDLI